MKFYIAIFTIIFSSNLKAFDQLQMFNRIIEKNIIANNICEDEANNREQMSKEIIDRLKEMNSKDRSSFIIYKHEIAMHKCQINKGHYPEYFMDSLYYSEETNKSIKDLIEKYKEINAKPNIIENIFNYESIDKETKEALLNSNYFEKPFRLSKIASQLRE